MPHTRSSRTVARCRGNDTSGKDPARASVRGTSDPLLIVRRSLGNAHLGHLQRSLRRADGEPAWENGTEAPATTGAESTTENENGIDDTTGQSCGEGGCCADCRRSGAQTKLVVGPPDDVHEQEADRVAEQLATGRSPTVRRLLGRPGPTAGRALDGELPTGGRPLSDAVLAFMEPRFGQDFTGVRVHNGPDTHRLADRIQARAFTEGRDIYLGRGESEHDRRLMAHELTHVLQQQATTARPVVRRTPDDTPAASSEPRAGDFSRITLAFDGAELTVQGDSREIFRFSAQSGRPVRLVAEHAKECGADPETDTYMNDQRFVGIKEFGPIPEGTYVFAPPGIEKFTVGERIKLELAGVIGKKNVIIDGREVHAGDWGSGRVALHPRGQLRQGQCGDVTTRDGFFLHGGNLSGSSGCIDIGGDFSVLAGFLTGYRGPVTVSVAYTKPPPSVGVGTGLSGAIAYGRFSLGHGPRIGLGAEFGPGGGRPLVAVGYSALLQWAVLRPAAQDERIHQALVQMGFKF